MKRTISSKDGFCSPSTGGKLVSRVVGELFYQH